MHHKYFGTLIQRRFSNFFFVNKLYSLDSRQSLGDSVRPLSELFLYKWYICNAKIQKKYP